MNRDSQRPTRAPPPKPEGEAEGEEPDEDRPTLVPDFDLAAFARQKMLKIETPTPRSEGARTPLPGGAPTVSSTSVDLGELFRAGDHDATLALSEALLQQDPNDAEARKYAEMSRLELTVTYLAAFGGSGSAIPKLKARLTGEMPAGVFADVLDAVDGISSVEEIVLTLRHDRLAVLSALCDLLRRGIIETV
jgi:hypothetical protein